MKTTIKGSSIIMTKGNKSSAVSLTATKAKVAKVIKAGVPKTKFFEKELLILRRETPVGVTIGSTPAERKTLLQTPPAGCTVVGITRFNAALTLTSSPVLKSVRLLKVILTVG